jgi:hypothetical protein
VSVLLLIDFFLLEVSLLVTLVTFSLLISCQQLVILGVAREEQPIVFGLFLLGAPESELFFEERREACEAWKWLVDRMMPQGVYVLQELIAKVDLNN